ncbi:hypothetical protein GOV12_03425 [Candidatus Pacearchaeota archaeon]|nr:hypothetical protein [Candidatus Pacearchaeota archaeon]
MQEYIHINSIGNQEECFKIFQEVAKVLSPLYKERKIISYGNYVYNNPIDINITVLGTDFQQFTDYKLPFFITRIHTTKDSNLNLEEIMQNIGFQKLSQLDDNPTTK